MPLADLAASAHGLGFVSTRGDADGIVRRAPLIAKANGVLVPSLGAEALRVAQGAGGMVVRSSDASGEVNAGAAEMVAIKIGEAEVPVNERGELWVHYTDDVPERTVAAWRVLKENHRRPRLNGLFAGRIVLIGTGAIGLRDLVSTPVARRDSRVQSMPRRSSRWCSATISHRPTGTRLEMAACSGRGARLGIAPPWLGAAAGRLLASDGGGAGAAGTRSAASKLLVDPTHRLLALLAAYLSSRCSPYLREETAAQIYPRRRSTAISRPSWSDASPTIRASSSSAARSARMTVLFCDIRGFSRISEAMAPQQIIRFIIAFLTPMTDILLARKATIDKYIGDAVLAFWNAPLDDPDQYRNAARGALEMIEAAASASTRDARRRTVPGPARSTIGIGLNSGPAASATWARSSAFPIR
jgi:adenylate cyclase